MEIVMKTLAFLTGFLPVFWLAEKWIKKPRYSISFLNIFWPITICLGGYGVWTVNKQVDDLAFVWGQGIGTGIGCVIIAYILTLILFGLGRMLGFIEKAAGVRDEEN